MAPLGEHLVGYLSMFLQLGVLVLLAALAMLVRASLGRRPLDPWTGGLAANAAALLVLGVAAVGRDAQLWPAAPATTVVYALLEDLAGAAFVAGARLARGARPVPWWLAASVGAAVTATAATAMRTGPFLDVYRVHAACFAVLLIVAAVELVRARPAGLGARLLVVALAALATDYAHVPLLALAGVAVPDSYLGLESYVTVVLDIAAGVALVVVATDAANVELRRRNAALHEAQRALHDLAYTDPLCGVPNRAAFLDAIVSPPRAGTVAMIDLDGLKAINDRFGHAAGDASLEMTARCLRERCAPRGRVYRIGGDEFAAVWDGVWPEEARATLAAVAGDLRVLAEDLLSPARISWGVAAFGGGVSFGDALIASDADLYEGRSFRRD
ncbi:MAG TPA: GGDEF domain-containing protein [Candidatus Elarobacter sp.]|jgi:diguanylate cyclase (GGDEF)-like protein|nr:GGDEF domain-containing protein [Candidatus Elarobacter sp.]